MRYEETFTADPENLASVRRFVRRLSPADVDIDLVVLLATELATNAVLHAGTPFDVVVEVGDRDLRVAVRDGDPRLPRVVQRGVGAAGGRGLHMVQVGAASWGAERDDGGKEIWFTVRRRADGA